MIQCNLRTIDEFKKIENDVKAIIMMIGELPERYLNHRYPNYDLHITKHPGHAHHAANIVVSSNHSQLIPFTIYEEQAVVAGASMYWVDHSLGNEHESFTLQQGKGLTVERYDAPPDCGYVCSEFQHSDIDIKTEFNEEFVFQNSLLYSTEEFTGQIMYRLLQDCKQPVTFSLLSVSALRDKVQYIWESYI